MTQEDKQLLLKDLCARLPYGVMIKDTYSGHYGRLVEVGNTFAYFISELNSNTLDVQLCHVKPYLRPMSSMTEEDIKEFRKNSDFEEREAYEVRANGENKIVILQADCDLSVKELDWLNEHHFDYRNLIEKGLALEAPPEMYEMNNNV